VKNSLQSPIYRANDETVDEYLKKNIHEESCKLFSVDSIGVAGAYLLIPTIDDSQIYANEVGKWCRL
jgi:hypothetical protein